MSLGELISEYGPFAIFIGAGVEGEAVAFLGGVFAHRHLLPYWQAATAAALGSFVADQLFFYTARYASRLRLVQRFTATSAMTRVTRLLETYPTGFILSFRFIYGIRIISPIAIGLSSVPARRFIVLNAIAAAVWGAVITGVGYLFGNVVETIFGRLRLHVHLMIALAVVLVLIVLATLVARKMMQKTSDAGAAE